jgi:hypothetical protein
MLAPVMSESDKKSVPAKRVVPYIGLTGKPYHISPELARELAAIVIEWGSFENAVTMDLEQLRNFALARQLEGRIPGAFGSKLKLWRRSIAVLFPTVALYNSKAEEIYLNARTTGTQRHKLIHGMWRPAGDDDPEAFYVFAGLDRRKNIDFFRVDASYLAAVHTDIKFLADAMWSLIATRMLHAAQGLLSAHLAPKDGNPAHPHLPSDKKR